MSTGAHAVPSAASTRPPRPAPNSAASLAAITTIAPPASAGRIRIAVGLVPKMSVVRASSTASGGWSTYPNARWWLATRKYSSSCWKPYRPLTASSSTTNTAAMSHARPGTRSPPRADATAGAASGSIMVSFTAASTHSGISAHVAGNSGDHPRAITGTCALPSAVGRNPVIRLQVDTGQGGMTIAWVGDAGAGSRLTTCAATSGMRLAPPDVTGYSCAIGQVP